MLILLFVLFLFPSCMQKPVLKNGQADRQEAQRKFRTAAYYWHSRRCKTKRSLFPDNVSVAVCVCCLSAVRSLTACAAVVRATLHSLLSREPRHLPACIVFIGGSRYLLVLHIANTIDETCEWCSYCCVARELGGNRLQSTSRRTDAVFTWRTSVTVVLA